MERRASPVEQGPLLRPREPEGVGDLLGGPAVHVPQRDGRSARRAGAPRPHRDGVRSRRGWRAGAVPRRRCLRPVARGRHAAGGQEPIRGDRRRAGLERRERRSPATRSASRRIAQARTADRPSNSSRPWSTSSQAPRTAASASARVGVSAPATRSSAGRHSSTSAANAASSPARSASSASPAPMSRLCGLVIVVVLIVPPRRGGRG